MTGERVFVAALMVLVVASVAADTLVYGHGVNVLAFPVAIAVCLCALSALRLTMLMRRGSGGATAAPMTLRPALWLAGALTAVIALGPTAALPAFALVYARAHGARWLTAVALAVAVFALIEGVFIRLLGMALPMLPILGIG